MASDVVDLSGPTEDFNNFVSEHPIVLAKFFAPWCGHCKKLAPEYESAASQLKEKDISLVEVDCEQNRELCAEHKVQGYPTLMVFRGTESVAPYNGGRSVDEIVQYMNRELLPSLTTVSSSNLEAFSTETEVAGLVLFDSDDKETNSTITNIANKFHHQFSFGASTDKEVAKELGVTKFPSFVVFSKHEDEPIIFNAEDDKTFTFTDEAIITRLMRHSIEPAGEITPSTFRAYMVSGLPLAYFFYASDEQRDQFSEALSALAKEHRSILNIGLIDGNVFGSHAPNINLNEENFPAFAIHDLDANKKFPISQDQELTIELITSHLNDYVSGKLTPDIKTEEVPEVQEGPVYKAVAGNWDDLVLDEDKDVLIEFYAPWCGHCKHLAPTYDELGALFFNNAELGSKVSVAKMDHTLNEIDHVTIAGYPTIMLYPAGKKDSPIIYESGDRSLEALNAFIRDKGTHGVDGLLNKTKSNSAKSSKKSKKTKKSKKAKKAKKAAAPSNDDL